MPTKANFLVKCKVGGAPRRLIVRATSYAAASEAAIEYGRIEMEGYSPGQFHIVSIKATSLVILPEKE